MMSENSVFRNTNFTLVFLGKAVSDIGALLYSFSVSFYILKITENNALIQGVYLALCSITCLLFTLPGGVLADRVHKAHIMAGCDLLKGFAILCVPFGMLFTQNDRIVLALLFAAGFLGNAAGGIFAPASSALLRLVVRHDQIQQAQSCFSVLNSLQSVAGILLAGILYGLLPIRLLFLIVGVCYLLSAVTEMLITYDFKKCTDGLTLRSGLADLAAGARYLGKRRDILSVIAIALMVNFFMNPVWGNFLPYFTRTDLAEAENRVLKNLITPEIWSSVFSICMALGSLAAAMVIGKRPQENSCGKILRRRLPVLALLLLILAGSYSVLTNHASSINGFLMMLCLMNCAVGIVLCRINISVNTGLLLKVSPDQLGKVSGIMSTASNALTPLASVLAGFVIRCAGGTILLWVCAICLCLVAIITLKNQSMSEI